MREEDVLKHQAGEVSRAPWAYASADVSDTISRLLEYVKELERAVSDNDSSKGETE